ncbi:FAD-dependent oxidoreductase [Acidicapsa acidisoli]|uniref:FAD-dependent oxidoreductase n=1 Tax=Acidicapsa acidisoli TaxID=1615681 RepID=UPI0021DF6266|nr:FAD-dependent oxidoreductase [Acidicapsa acidisoli]
MANDVLQTTCCVVGGGPAGMVLAYLLARRGVQVTVLEKHEDFFRDFRGDTVHPSTLEVLKELGLLKEFLALPHEEVESLGVIIGDSEFNIVDFRHVPATCKFVALMPQWDFLNFLSSHANRFPSFQLLMQHEATDLLKEGKRIRGVVARHNGQEVRVHADLVVACDGRHSRARTAARLKVIEHGVPIDVLWFQISRKPGDPAQVLGNVNYGKALILINRSDYFQAGLIIEKGSYEDIKARGLDAFRADIRSIAPYLGDRVNELHDWDQIKILTVQINRLRRWYRPGLLCIGDAAHAMSPAGGVGINLAIQDAVAAANILTRPLLERRVPESTLAKVQKRRELPTRATQAIQLTAHRGLARVFENPGPIHVPWQAKAAARIPGIQRAVGYAVGMGVRPEHVREETSAKPRRSLAATAVFAALATGACAAFGMAAATGVLTWAAWKAWNRATEAAS